MTPIDEEKLDRLDPERTTDMPWAGGLEWGPFPVVWGAASDAGAVREHNEDSCMAGRGIFVVADGMGGHSRGDAASSQVVRSFSELDQGQWDAAGVQRALDLSNERVRRLASQGPPPGTTVVGVALAGDSSQPQWLIFNIGDSRAYLWRSGALEQISVDHSRAQEIRDSGIPGAAELAAHLDRNVITRAIGGGSNAAPIPDQWLLEANRGDRVLLCSDGLSTELSDREISEMLDQVLSPQQTAMALVQAAVAAGGHDNVTVLIVEALGESPQSALESASATTIPDLRALTDAPGQLSGDDLGGSSIGVEFSGKPETQKNEESDARVNQPRRAALVADAPSEGADWRGGTRFIEPPSADPRSWNEWGLQPELAGH